MAGQSVASQADTPLRLYQIPGDFTVRLQLAAIAHWYNASIYGST